MVTRYTEAGAECSVFSYRHGVLSAIGHDLKLAVTRFFVEVDDPPTAVEAEFDARSLSVVGAMQDGEERAAALSEAEKRKIAEQIRVDVLHSDRYPSVRFRSSRVAGREDGGYDLEGELELHGVKQKLACTTKLVAGRQVLELRLNQPNFGIKPFSAMLGALRVQPEVRVRVVV